MTKRYSRMIRWKKEWHDNRFNKRFKLKFNEGQDQQFQIALHRKQPRETIDYDIKLQ